MIKPEIVLVKDFISLLKNASKSDLEFFINQTTRDIQVEDEVLKQFAGKDATFFYKSKMLQKPMGKIVPVFDLVLKRRELDPTGELNSEISKFLWYDTTSTDKITKTVSIIKAANEDEEERTVFGEVLVPDEVDAHGDIYSADEVRKAAWFFMENFGNIGFMHRFFVNGDVKILESYVTQSGMTITDSKGNDRKIKKGTWLMRVRVISDSIWQMVKEEKLTGFSIGGVATVQQLKKFIKEFSHE